MKQILFIILIASLLILVSCKTETTQETCNIITGECSGEEIELTEAEKNCKENQGFLDERDDVTYCIFKDGTECEVESYNNGTCGEIKTEEETIPPKEIQTIQETSEYSTTINVKEGENVNLKVLATDADGDKLTYKFSAPLNNKGEWQTKEGDAGSYEISVEVSDGQAEDIKKVLIIVEESNHAPTITIDGNLNVKEGETITLDITAEDIEGDETIITLFDKRFKQQGNKFIWETSYTDAGEYDIKIEASDGKSGVSKTITVVVEDKNRPPVITEIN